MNESTKITLYADGKPYQVIDLKDIDGMSEEEYNDKLKDAWFKKTHYETVEELTMSKYYNYEVEEEKNTEETKNNKSLGLLGDVITAVLAMLFFGGILGTLFWILGSLISGG